MGGVGHRGGEGRASRLGTACTRPRIRKEPGTFQEQRGAREAEYSERGRGCERKPDKSEGPGHGKISTFSFCLS